MLVRLRRPDDDMSVASLLGPDAALEAARVHVAEEAGQVAAAALWLREAGSTAQLGTVATKDPNRRDVFYTLIRACAQAMIDDGCATGSFTVDDPALLDRIQRDFDVRPEEIGWRSGRPVAWRIEVDLVGAVRQLDRALARLGAA